jgi:alpha-N-arabinofuranosidase
MSHPITRRNFISTAAALSATTLVPKRLFAAASTAAPSTTQRVVIRTDAEVGIVRPEFHGHFIEHLGSCVYGGLWVGKNSRIPNIDGYRKQAIEYLKELSVPVLRWPGGCFADDYHWRDGIGPASKRPKRVNIHWGNYVEDGSFGTHEFIGLCRLLGAEPYLAGNVGSSTPHELRDWIEYCNYPSGSSLSDERASNGSLEPLRVRYWGVGNESWGCGGNMRPEEYARLYRDFSVYCREFGGTELFLIASGPSGDDSRWSRGLMDGLGWERPSGVSMHYYCGAPDLATQFTAEHMSEQFATYAKVEESIVHQRAVLDSYERGRDVGLILDEWGVWDRIPEEDEKRNGKLWQQSTMRSAVAAGLGLNIFNRQADKLYMCNLAQMVNVLQSLLLTNGPDGEHCVRTTTYHAFSMFKPHRTKTAVRVEADNPTPLGLSVSASRSDRQVVVSFVNPHHDSDLQVDCAIKGGAASTAAAQILHDKDWNAFNSFENPDRIVPAKHPVRMKEGGLELDLPRLSLVTVVMAIR